MTEDAHDVERRRYEAAAEALQASIRQTIDQTPPGHPVVGFLEWAGEELDRTPYLYQRPNTELRHAPPAIPGGCYEASFGWVHVRPGCRCPR